jgi:hypothetical protein
MASIHHDATLTPVKPIDDAVSVILDSLRRIRFGSIAVTVHEGKIVQLDITEKRRLTR